MADESRSSDATTWHIERAKDDADGSENAKLDRLLAEGWQPFAVTEGDFGGFVYHLRHPGSGDTRPDGES